MNRSQLKQLLDFKFDRDRFFGFVDAGFNREVLDKNLTKLVEIGDSMLEVRDLTEEEIRLLVRRIHKLWEDDVDPSDVKLSLLEARSIGYGLEKSTELDFAFFVHKILELEKNWTPSCLRGFLHSTLRLWNEMSPSVRNANSTFIARHSKGVDEELSKAARYISTDGPAKLGSDIRKQRKSFLWAPTAVLMPTTRFNYTFFSDTLLAYFKEVKKNEYEDLKTALNLHNQVRTDKILLPNLILKSDSFSKALLDIASKRIGDPFDESKWASFDGATDDQKKALFKARKKLLGWILQEIIRGFFEVLCDDKERKVFWTKHVHQIHDFTVFGSHWTKRQLLGCLPSQSVIRHFQTVDSTVDNCALAMYIGEYVIIEFTQVGALYAYRVGGEYYRQAFRYARSLSKIDDLKIPTITQLYNLDYHRFSREGKMEHRGWWDERMDKWLNHVVAPTFEEE